MYRRGKLHGGAPDAYSIMDDVVNVSGFTSGPAGYTTTFPLTEGTISEGGIWLAPATGWTSVTTASGNAYGTETPHSPPPFDDSYAIIDSTKIAFNPNQSVQCNMHAAGTIPGARAQEVELLLRMTQGSNTISGYEIDIKITGAFHFIRWNGPLNDYSNLLLDQTNNVVIADGANWQADIIGTVITVRCNGVVCSTYDTAPDSIKWSTGQPGMGFFGVNGDVAADFGWASFTATSV